MADGSEYLDRFMKVFSNVPVVKRDEVVVVVDGQPISWNLAYKELKTKGELSEAIAEKLIELDII